MTFPDRIPSLRVLARSLGPDVIKLSNVVLDHPNFATWTGSVTNKQHHYGRGGLQEHTFEVIAQCMLNRTFLMREPREFEVSERTLFLAALFHDFGKLWDYEPLNAEMTEWGSAPHKRTIHHISRSAICWTHAVRDTGCGSDIEDEVLHAILSHHGQREYGSPVFPKTRVAWLLHLCDSMSARLNDCDRIDLAHSQ